MPFGFRFPWSPHLYRIGCVMESETEPAPPLYRWEHWRKVYPLLDAVLAKVDQPAFIRSYQSPAGHNRKLAFGRMKWSAETNERWTTRYLDGPDPVEFLSAEVWAPDWSRIDEHGGYPDVFCSLDRVSWPQRQGFVLAIRKGLLPEVAKEADAVFDAVKALFPNPGAAVFDRIWAEREYFFRAIRENELHAVASQQVLDWARAHPTTIVEGFASR